MSGAQRGEERERGKKRRGGRWVLATAFLMGGVWLSLGGWSWPVRAEQLVQLNGEVESRLGWAEVSSGDGQRQYASRTGMSLKLNFSGPVLDQWGEYSLRLSTAMDQPVLPGLYRHRLGRGDLRGLEFSTKIQPGEGRISGEVGYGLRVKEEPEKGEVLPYWEEIYTASFALTAPDRPHLYLSWRQGHLEDSLSGWLRNYDTVNRSLTISQRLPAGTASLGYTDFRYEDFTSLAPLRISAATRGDLRLRIGTATDLSLALHRLRNQEGAVENCADSYFLQVSSHLRRQHRLRVELKGTFSTLPADQAVVRHHGLTWEAAPSGSWRFAAGYAQEGRWQADTASEEPRHVLQASAAGQVGEELVMDLYAVLDQPAVAGGTSSPGMTQLSYGGGADWRPWPGIQLRLGVEEREEREEGAAPQAETDVKPGLRYQREFRPGFTGGVDLGATVGNRADGWKVRSIQESGQLRGRLPRDWVLDLTLTHHGTLAQTGQWLQAATAGASVSRVLRTGASASLSYRWGVSASSEEGRSQEAALRWAEPWWIGTYFAEARWSQRSKSSDPLYTREWWWVSTGMRIAF